jgi:transcription antitermination factor NusG
MDKKGNWYVLYTKPRWEKKVDRVLKEKGIISYCPLNKVRKKWSDRYKIIEEPLFKSYDFVFITPEDMEKVRAVNGVVNFVYWNGRPAKVKDWEIDNIKRFMNEFLQVEAIPLELKANTKVLIHHGVMMGQEATVERVLHNVVELRIESFGYKLIAKIDRSNIVALET